MLKAILYFFLLIAEFFITILISGFCFGLYYAYIGSDHMPGNSKGDMTTTEMFPFIIAFALIATLIIWFTFHKGKFSSFTLGKVKPERKWQLMLYGSMPMLGFIIAYYALMSYLGIHFMPKEMSQFGFFQILPLMLVGTFISAYVFYGAILEELLKSGKKKWVVLLVYLLMIMPLWIFYVLAALPCTLYGFWLYCKTRSSIVIFAVYLISNMIPFNLGSNWVTILVCILGLGMMGYGFYLLKKNIEPLLIQEDEEEKEY
jgi:uncharacterized membrane-anchored protein